MRQIAPALGASQGRCDRPVCRESVAPKRRLALLTGIANVPD
jgi:hypothetical protein